MSKAEKSSLYAAGRASGANPAMIGTQYAALCWRNKGKKAEVLLITSRDTGRWVIPKGWPMEDRGPAGTAAQEAWEEAGVRGDIATEAIGCFHYDKLFRKAPALNCTVEVFPMRIEKLARRWPEKAERRRKWFSAKKAAAKVNEPELKAILRDLAGTSGQARLEQTLQERAAPHLPSGALTDPPIDLGQSE